MLFLLVTLLLVGATGDHYCPVETSCDDQVSKWLSNKLSLNAKVIVIYNCLCDGSYNDVILESIYNEVTIAGSLGGVITFTNKGNQQFKDWNEFSGNESCFDACSIDTPTSTTGSLLEMLLNITHQLVVEQNEVHIIGISKATSDHLVGVAKTKLITELLNVINKDLVTIHYIVNSVDVMKLLGDPDLSVTYSDHTHFNKALTLNKLVDSNLSDTIQSYCLAKGIELQISWYKSMLDKEQLKSALYHVLWSTLTIRNKCLLLTCSKYCSPLHGCITNDDKHSDINTSKLSLSDVQFKTSHAEYTTNVFHSESNGSQLSIVQSLPTNSTAPTFSLNDVIVGEPEIFTWYSNEVSFGDIIAKNKPLLINSVDIQKWRALKVWNMSYVRNNIGIDVLPFVKCTNNYLTFDPDNKSALKLNLSLPYLVKNMTKEMFFDCVISANKCDDNLKGHYYFGKVPFKLKSDLSPNSFLYNTEEDIESNKQYIWISSSGMITHGHFDQDHNLFIQLIGTKRFTLWSPSQHELLYMFPRVHPMWHKSRINFRQIDLDQFPTFAKSRALQVTVSPGQILYIPPYTWHYVETLSPSISLSTWSHDYHMYSHMNAIYGHDHKFDLIASPRGQMFTLRVYLDLLVQELYGFNETTKYFAKLLSTRFTGLEDLFPPERNDSLICEGNQIPLSYHTLGYVKLDVQVIANHFKALQPEVMDILFQDYIEEVSAQVVGVNKILSFYYYCFQGQSYYITTSDDKEHLLWEHID